MKSKSYRKGEKSNGVVEVEMSNNQKMMDFSQMLGSVFRFNQ